MADEPHRGGGPDPAIEPPDGVGDRVQGGIDRLLGEPVHVHDRATHQVRAHRLVGVGQQRRGQRAERQGQDHPGARSARGPRQQRSGQGHRRHQIARALRRVAQGQRAGQAVEDRSAGNQPLPGRAPARQKRRDHQGHEHEQADRAVAGLVLEHIGADRGIGDREAAAVHAVEQPVRERAERVLEPIGHGQARSVEQVPAHPGHVQRWAGAHEVPHRRAREAGERVGVDDVLDVVEGGEGHHRGGQREQARAHQPAGGGSRPQHGADDQQRRRQGQRRGELGARRQARADRPQGHLAQAPVAQPEHGEVAPGEQEEGHQQVVLVGGSLQQRLGEQDEDGGRPQGVRSAKAEQAGEGEEAQRELPQGHPLHELGQMVAPRQRHRPGEQQLGVGRCRQLGIVQLAGLVLQRAVVEHPVGRAREVIAQGVGLVGRHDDGEQSLNAHAHDDGEQQDHQRRMRPRRRQRRAPPGPLHGGRSRGAHPAPDTGGGERQDRLGHQQPSGRQQVGEREQDRDPHHRGGGQQPGGNRECRPPGDAQRSRQQHRGGAQQGDREHGARDRHDLCAPGAVTDVAGTGVLYR